MVFGATFNGMFIAERDGGSFLSAVSLCYSVTLPRGPWVLRNAYIYKLLSFSPSNLIFLQNAWGGGGCSACLLGCECVTLCTHTHSHTNHWRHSRKWCCVRTYQTVGFEWVGHSLYSWCHIKASSSWPMWWMTAYCRIEFTFKFLRVLCRHSAFIYIWIFAFFHQILLNTAVGLRYSSCAVIQWDHRVYLEVEEFADVERLVCLRVFCKCWRIQSTCCTKNPFTGG